LGALVSTCRAVLRALLSWCGVALCFFMVWGWTVSGILFGGPLLQGVIAFFYNAHTATATDGV
jgi:hypothetical protein